MSEELKPQYPDLYVPYNATIIDGGFSINAQAYETATHPIHYVHKAKLRAYEAKIEELNKQVDKWMGDYQRIYNDWGGQNEFLKRENDHLKAKLSVALDRIKELHVALRNIGKWDHRGAAVSDVYDYDYGNGAFEKLLK